MHHLKQIYLALFLIVFTLYSCHTQKATLLIQVETGVSAGLAKVRKEAISNLSYALNLDIPAEKEMEIKGTETIVFDYKKMNMPLQLDFKPFKGGVELLKVNGQQVPYSFDKEHIILQEKYLANGRNAIEILFIAGDLSLNRNQEYVYTLLVPDRARTVFPCFDQPDLKAKFQLSLKLPIEWTALSNASVKDSLVEKGSKVLNFKESDLMSTYLFSFAAGKFTPEKRMVKGQEMTFFHRETDTAKVRLSLDPIFDLHGKALAFMEEYSKIPYPFEKFDFVAIPDFQYGGMEHVGAVQYKAASLFLDDGATLSQERSRSHLIAHETAHMWFGDLVTMSWFDDVWMKEVFANFMADKIAETHASRADFKLKFLIDHVPSAYQVDRTKGANPIRQPLANLQEAGTLYGDIIYHKSPIMMRQLEKLMGAEEFQNGLQDYLRNYANSNATWPDLIQLLDDRTPYDLQEWNRVWVNEAGRPKFTSSLHLNGKTIDKLVISQQGEDGSSRLWPQYIEIALVYPDRIESLGVNMNQASVEIKAASKKENPLFIVFNSSGEGYGLFPVDRALLSHADRLTSPLMRASAAINLYENMLNGMEIKSLELLQFYERQLALETEELTIKLISGQLTAIFWKFITCEQRAQYGPMLEKSLWKAMERQQIPGAKKTLFQAYQQIAMSKEAQDRLFSLWSNQSTPVGVKLSEDDYTNLAFALALRAYPNHKEITRLQFERIQNPDRKKRFAFLLPAISEDKNERDHFFASLKNPENREVESWVTMALGYLHHPLRAKTSQNYLLESLELLEEIQETGDIFFPASWLNASFGSYQSDEAKKAVQDFFANHPKYNPKLKAKILQATDNLFRATSLLTE